MKKWFLGFWGVMYLCAAWQVAGTGSERRSLNRWLDAGDGYRLQGDWVALGRMADEWVVPVDASAALCADGSLQPLTGEGQLSEAHGEGRLLQRASGFGLQRSDAHSVRRGLDEVRAQVGGAHVNPVYADPRTGLRLIPRGRIVVRLAPGVAPDSLLLPFEVAERLSGTQDQYVLRLSGTTAEAMLARVSSLGELPQVVWAEPDFLKEWGLHRMLNDARLSEQWHLQNTGYTLLNGSPYSPAGVDISAPDAWDRQMGSEDVVIAVIDDGVQAAHPDLQANIFINAGEVAGSSGVDDDGNGYSDDVSGWDFINDTNTPEPKVAGDGHGVATAGLAAARGDNSIGVSGVAPFCKILPLKIFQGDSYVGSSALANAIRYAAGLTSPNPWRGADVLNMSFGGGAPSLIEDSAFTDAATLGRQGKGCVLIASSGNSASDYYRYSQSLPPGNYYFEWRYTKDGAVSAGDDTCRLGLVLFPDGSIERFDLPTPPAGWDFTPEAGIPGWVIEENPAKAYGLGRYQARAQPMQSNNSYALCRSRPVKFAQTNRVTFYYWISSEFNYDFIEFRAVKAGESPPAFTQVDSGVYDIDPYVSYPASHPHVIAVGATTEFDYRSYFSQYGEDLDLLAPGGGGLVNIVTTDRTGADGYNTSDDFTTTFAGTSASAPIVSGAAALLLSRHPDLTAPVVRALLCRTADKVGPVAYTGGEAGAGGRNNYYGYGRLNVGRLLWLARISVVAGHGGLFATADDTTNFFCEPVAFPTLLTEPDQYFTFQQWQVSPASNAVVFAPAMANTGATVFDDVTFTATFSALLAARGTPLYWLASYGLNSPSFDAAEETDDDIDGHAAWQEWQAGTDPVDGASILRVSALDRLADGRCVVQWLSVSNRVYDVLTSVAPDGTSPTVLASGIVPTAPLNVYTSVPLPAATQFIRVRTEVP